jgi:hypothetical protein
MMAENSDPSRPSASPGDPTPWKKKQQRAEPADPSPWKKKRSSKKRKAKKGGSIRALNPQPIPPGKKKRKKNLGRK